MSIKGRQGYRADHLCKFVVTLLNASAIADDVLPVAGNTDARLYYEQFSIVMSKSRRLALFTVVNIDGSASVLVSRSGDPWAFDGRIVELSERTLLFGAFKTYQRSVLAIEGLTNLNFGELHQFDGFSNEDDATGEVVRTLILRANDIRV